MLEIYTQLGFAHGMLYCPLLLLLVFSHDSRLITFATAAAMTLTALGYFISPPAPEGFSLHLIIGNRIISIIAIGLTGLLCMQTLRYVAGLKAVNKQLQITDTRLKEQNRILTMAGKIAQFGGWHFDVASQTMTWSDEVAILHGHAPGYRPTIEEALNYYTETSRPKIEKAFSECVSKGTAFDLHLQINALHGNTLWVRAIGQPLLDSNRKVYAVEGAFMDVSSQKRIEKELALSENNFRKLADAMPIIVWTTKPDGKIEYFNTQLSRFTGVPTDALTKPGGWLMIIHPDDRENAVESWQKAAYNQDSYHVEFRILRADGIYVWHLTRATPIRNADGVIVRYYGTSIDVQELKDLQSETEYLAQRLRSTIESITDGFFTLDKQFRFTFINSKAQTILKRDHDQLIGNIIWEVTDIPQDSELIRQFYITLDSHQATAFETHWEADDMWLDVRTYPATDGLTAYLQDITQQRKDQEQLRQAQRLESLGHLTGGIAHDFNNLLTVIMGNAELLMEEISPEDDKWPLAEIISNAANRGSQLTSRLLAFARRQPLDPKIIDINQAVRNMTSLLQHTLGEHIEISLIALPDIWPAMVDPGQLESALLNLAINARDAMPSGGKLTIETNNVELDESYAAHHGEIAPGEYVVLALSDTGSGISHEHLARVFEPFFTTKEKGKGTGLGLSMVYGFVKQSEGHINIYSELGEGTTIRIYLPRAADSSEELPTTPTEVQSSHEGHETLLLVEDDELVLQFAKRQLELAGYNVITAENGPIALDIFKSSEDIDLLFTDVVMPGGMSGRDLAGLCQLHNPSLKVLYTSGYTQNSIVHNGRLDPGVLLLEKPYKRHDLLQKVREALSSHNE
ncbi:PAS domain-containing protein [Nitrincola sp. MINF-07-Sa-05]|uniref:PAS domain-containing protein n=1 Tax=Nitrincola salilacus TaxID=3400273 RepID=UPI003917CE97